MMPDDLVARLLAQAASEEMDECMYTALLLQEAADALARAENAPERIAKDFAMRWEQYARGVNDALGVVEAYAEATRGGGQYMSTLSIGAANCADRIRALLDPPEPDTPTDYVRDAEVRDGPRVTGCTACHLNLPPTDWQHSCEETKHNDPR